MCIRTFSRAVRVYVGSAYFRNFPKESFSSSPLDGTTWLEKYSKAYFYDSLKWVLYILKKERERLFLVWILVSCALSQDLGGEGSSRGNFCGISRYIFCSLTEYVRLNVKPSVAI